jgi:hypothetical protein
MSLIEEHEKLSPDFLTAQSLVHYKCYQSVFRCVRAEECTDDRRNCFILQTSDDPNTRYFSTETPEELAKIKSAWYRANYNSVITLGVRED